MPAPPVRRALLPVAGKGTRPLIEFALEEARDARLREQRGLGHAVLIAAHLLEGAPSAVMLPDDLLPGPPFALRDPMAAHRDSGRAAVLLQSWDLVEKPAPAAAPSRFGAVGRYVLPASIPARLEDVAPGAGREIQLTDALAAQQSVGAAQPAIRRAEARVA